MILLIHLTIEHAVIFYQQDTICNIMLSNSGQSAISLPLMDMDASFPIMYVCDKNTGQENTYRGRPSPHIKSAPMMLAPGEKIEDQFSLLSKIPNLLPGEYEISIGWEFNKTETARSNTVQIKILPSTPARLNLVNLIGGQSGNKLGAWIDLANDPHQLLYGGFDLNIGGGTSILKNIISCKELVRPVFSAPVNQAPLQSKKIAWTSEKGLNYAYIDEDSTKIKPKSIKLPGTDAEIVGPLYSINALEPGALQDSVALIYTGLSSAAQFQLQTIRLSAKKANVIGQVNLPGPKPLWIANHARTEQKLLITYLQADGHTLTLHSAPWPGITSEFSRPTRLAEFKGRFLAADATLVGNGVIYGGILMWKHLEDGTSKLVLLPWTLDENNNFKIQPEHAIDWEPADLIQKSIMRVSDEGRPVALFTDAEETWHIYDGKGKVFPMPAPYQKTKQLIEIGFINGISDPLLICGTIHNGFKIIQLDGSPIPPRMTK
jgi:hypothetical protein